MAAKVTDLLNSHSMHRTENGHWCYRGTDGNWKPFDNDSHYMNTAQDMRWEIQFFVKASMIQEVFEIQRISALQDVL